MDHTGDEIMKLPLSTNLEFWFRYVDHVLSCWRGIERQLDLFLRGINRIHDDILFAMEKEREGGSLDFLDITKRKLLNKLDFSIYHKFTHTDSTTDIFSLHPHPHKMAKFNTYVDRLLSVPISPAMSSVKYHKTNSNK